MPTEYIRRCEAAHGEHDGRWIIQTYHAATGMQWADQECPHYATRADATAVLAGPAVEIAYERARHEGYTGREALRIAKAEGSE